MTENQKPQSGSPEEADPLSATAMFFRTLDKQQGGQGEPSAAFEAAPGGRSSSSAGAAPQAAEGEFTAIFSRSNPSHSSQASSIPVAPSPVQPRPAADSDSSSAGKQGPGEFTRLFVKGSATTPKSPARSTETSTETTPATPPRARGYSAPGASDAASTDSGFTDFFKLDAKGGNPVPQRNQPSHTPPPQIERPSRSEVSFAGSNEGQISASSDSPSSITGIIKSLSSPAGRAEPAPYRAAEATPSSQAPLKPSASPEIDSGGVTQFIHKLTDLPAAPAPPPAPVREPNTGPGEYTRIISAPSQPVPTITAPPATQTEPAPSIGAFVRPSVPAMPSAAPVPHLPQVPPHAAPAMAVPVAKPAPHLPPAPAPATVAAPKGKLEALTPILLIVNTFLLVVILVVMLFLIKGR